MPPTSVAQDKVRHTLADRLFHWCMAVAVIVLLFSAFLPIAGLQFDWVIWHWISGVVLLLAILFHIIRALFFQGLSEMLPGRARSNDETSSATPPKYDFYQKTYHWGTAIIILALLITGVPMLIKLDTFLWQRNPSILTDMQWGFVYVVHGIAAMVLIFTVILHIYFTLLPEHRALLVAMLRGSDTNEKSIQKSKKNDVKDSIGSS